MDGSAPTRGLVSTRFFSHLNMLTPDATSAAAMNPRMTGSGTDSETFFAVAYDAAIAEAPSTAATSSYGGNACTAQPRPNRP